MAKTFDQLEPRAALAEIAREFYQRGWMPGTAGNLSARVEDNAGPGFWITASGMPKGQLDATDFLLVSVRDDAILERLRPTHKPSAETSIHRAIYRTFPLARACLHVHSVDACISASRVPPAMTTLRLPPLEVLKGFGLWEENPQIDLPVFENWLDVPRIACDIEQRFAATPPRIDALVIRDHGITVWGETLQQAFNRVEVVEFIMSYMARTLAGSSA
jgi:methylthioribulose-1-phosphate dehydratase